MDLGKEDSQGLSMDNRQIGELTVSELKELIQKTVQRSMAEVLIEFAFAAELDSQIIQEAEMTDYLRTSLSNLPFSDSLGGLSDLDD